MKFTGYLMRFFGRGRSHISVHESQETKKEKVSQESSASADENTVDISCDFKLINPVDSDDILSDFEYADLYGNRACSIHGTRHSAMMRYIKSEFVDSHLRIQIERIGTCSLLNNFETMHVRAEYMNRINACDSSASEDESFVAERLVNEHEMRSESAENFIEESRENNINYAIDEEKPTADVKKLVNRWENMFK